MSSSKPEAFTIKYSNGTSYTYVAMTVLCAAFGFFLIFRLEETGFGIFALAASILFGILKYRGLTYNTPTLFVDQEGLKWNEEFYAWNEIGEISSNHDKYEMVVKLKIRGEERKIDMTEFDMSHLELEMRLLEFKALSDNEGA